VHIPVKNLWHNINSGFKEKTTKTAQYNPTGLCSPRWLTQMTDTFKNLRKLWTDGERISDNIDV
jgi:hypothetical protein